LSKRNFCLAITFALVFFSLAGIPPLTGFYSKLLVFIGTCFLTVCYFRIHFGHFTREHHFGFEAAAWYWHFVDVVWLFLFVTIYWWGS
jgi:cytochrome c oxidase subunit 3